MTSVLETLDWIVLSIYFLALIAVAVWVVLQKNKNRMIRIKTTKNNKNTTRMKQNKILVSFE